MKPTRFASLVLLSCFLAAGAAPAQQKAAPADAGLSPRPSVALDSSQRGGGSVSFGMGAAWILTDEERIARRTTPSAPTGRIGAAAVSRGDHREQINGLEHPELFLPYELFDQLVLGLSSKSTQREHARSEYDSRISAFGYNVPKFWETLRIAAQPYVTAQEARSHRGGTLFVSSHGNKTFVPISRDLCGQRVAALQNARELLGGKDFFDRFLYSVVAARMKHVAVTTAPDPDDQLRFMAGGCR